MNRRRITIALCFLPFASFVAWVAWVDPFARFLAIVVLALLPAFYGLHLLVTEDE